MKNIFKYIIPCLAMAFAFASCDDTMDDKSVIDSQYESQFKTATISISSLTAPAFNTINVACAVGDANDVAEQGIQISTTDNFDNASYMVNDTVEAAFSMDVDGLDELSTYYVRAYAMSKNGNVVYSNSQSITTPEAPTIPIEGVYTATEIDRDDAGNWKPADRYKMLIEFEEGSTEIVNITNIWNGGMTVQGVYDEAKGTITVPNYLVIYNHATYGEVWIQGVNQAVSAYTSSVTFTYNKKGGLMVSTPMGAICAAGAFGFFYLEMQHD